MRPTSARTVKRPTTAGSRAPAPAASPAAVATAAETSAAPAALARPSTATAAGRDIAAGGAASRVTVGVRVRPVNAKFDPDGSKVVVTRDPLADLQLCVDDGKRGRTFAYDHVFTTTQEAVYVALGRPMLDEAYKGFNVCLFAYGQTGSGKTHSIQGTAEDEGLVPRFVKDMFRCAQEKVEADPDLTVKVTMSYLEVYMEKVRDLLGPRTRGQEPENLELIDVKGRVVAKGASVHSVLGADRVAELLEIGNANRQVAETKMNEVSSRSHSIVQFTLSQLHESVDRRDTESTVTIVDLAGSERQGKTESSGLQFEEAKKINQSLLVLGRALNSFSDARGDMVSLRDSKLTRLLSECFGGNAKTWMLATVAPTAFNVTETLSTLEYATHAKSITNKVTINAVARKMEYSELRDREQKLLVALENIRATQGELEHRRAAALERNAKLGDEIRRLINVDPEIAYCDALAESDRLRKKLHDLLMVSQTPRVVDDGSLQVECYRETATYDFTSLGVKGFEYCDIPLPCDEVSVATPSLNLNAFSWTDTTGVTLELHIVQVRNLPPACGGGATVQFWLDDHPNHVVSTPRCVNPVLNPRVDFRKRLRWEFASGLEVKLPSIKLHVQVTGYC